MRGGEETEDSNSGGMRGGTRREDVQPSLDFGILQRRRASLKPGESVGRYAVGDEDGRTGLCARKAGMKEGGRG